MNPSSLTLPLLSVAIGLAVAGCAGNGAAPTASDQAIIQQGNRLHQAFAPAVLNEDANLRRYVQQVGQRLAQAAEQMHRANAGPASHFTGGSGRSEWMFGDRMRFQLLDCDVPNGLAPGGTHLYIYNGLFQRCRSEEELAAAMAHLYGHLYARHRQQQSVPDDQASPEEIVTSIVNTRHAPADEQEADEVGFQLFARAGWDPLSYGNLAQRLQETPRAEAARAMAEQLPLAALDWARPPIADRNRFEAYQQSAQAMARSEVADELMLLLMAVPSCLTSSDLPEQRSAQQQLLSPLAPIVAPAPFEKGPRLRNQ